MMSRRSGLLVLGLVVLALVIAITMAIPQWVGSQPAPTPTPIAAHAGDYPAPRGSIATPVVVQPPSPVAMTSATISQPPSPLSPAKTAPESAPATIQRYTYRVVNFLPHDANAFTQGLVYADGVFYEGTGRNGQSSLRKVEPATGAVLQQHDLEEEYFGEGIALFDNKIYQLTWQSNTGFIYDRETFAELSRFAYPTEGWGLTDDGAELIMSDGTATLYFWDPETLQETRRLDVTYQGEPLTQLNELEYFDDAIWANVWKTDAVVRIDPTTGVVDGVVDLRGLLNYAPAVTAPVDVLNGIAYDDTTGRLFVTGKLWPAVFEIELAAVAQ